MLRSIQYDSRLSGECKPNSHFELFFPQQLPTVLLRRSTESTGDFLHRRWRNFLESVEMIEQIKKVNPCQQGRTFQGELNELGTSER
jgi:hypothetical protein